LNKKLSTVFLFMICMVLTACNEGCKKAGPLPGEDAATYKRRMLAIYSAQTATGIDAVSDAIKVIVEGGAMDKVAGVKAIQIDTKAASVWVIANERLKQGFTDAETVTKLNDLINDIEQLEKKDVIPFKSDKARVQFLIITGGLKTSITAYKNLITAVQGPTFDTKVKGAQGDLASAGSNARDITWIFNLSNVVINAMGRIANQSWLPTAQAAYEDGEKIISELTAKNTALINDWSATR